MIKIYEYEYRQSGGGGIGDFMFLYLSSPRWAPDLLVTREFFPEIAPNSLRHSFHLFWSRKRRRRKSTHIFYCYFLSTFTSTAVLAFLRIYRESVRPAIIFPRHVLRGVIFTRACCSSASFFIFDEHRKAANSTRKSTREMDGWCT